jgi:hypothetical protein
MARFSQAAAARKTRALSRESVDLAELRPAPFTADADGQPADFSSAGRLA